MSDVIPTTDLAELFERAVARGYVLLSELNELHDPLVHHERWVEDSAQVARDQGIEVIDDLVEDIERPEASPLSASSDSVRQYLNEIGRTELLTAEQEVDLAKRYQAGLEAAQLLAQDPDMPRAQRVMLQRINRQGEAAKDHMVRANLRLVVSVARKFRGRGVDLLSLIQEGNLGLIRGVEKFDHTKGYKFSTYATWWIRQALQRGLANTGRTVRLPVHVHELMGKVRYAEFALLQQLGREPTEHEVAAELELPIERLREVKVAAQDVASLDKPIGEDGDATMGELVADDSAVSPEDSATAVLSRFEVERALGALSVREREVLMLRYGLVDGEEHTLEDIGEQFGLTRERIRQIEKKTLTKLRHPSRGFQLHGLLDSVDAGDRPGGQDAVVTNSNEGVRVADLAIIGAGPTGLYAAYYAGFRGLSTVIIDSLEEPGGQLTALYPEKPMYDVAGFPSVLGKDLVAGCVAQAATYDPTYLLGHRAEKLERVDAADERSGLRITTDRGEIVQAGAVLIAGGIGTFAPRPLPGSDVWDGRGLQYFVRDLEALRGQRVLIVGGGDSAVDWALALEEMAASVTLVHRRAGFRAHEGSMKRLESSTVDVRVHHEVRRIEGGDRLERVVVFDNRSDEETVLEVDSVIAALGFTADLGPLRSWDIEHDGRRIRTDSRGQTSLPGVYAAGDVVDYPGKVPLISTGFGEAATAVNNAAVWLDPEARLMAGHSSDG